MPFYNVNGFIYDSETNNIRVQFTRPADVDYDYLPETGPAYEIVEAQIFLDGATVMVGKYYPQSVDGTIPAHVEGRDLGQLPDIEPQTPLPEESD